MSLAKWPFSVLLALMSPPLPNSERARLEESDTNGIVVGILSVADWVSTDGVSGVSAQGHGCSRLLGRQCITAFGQKWPN
jgi:hypothetical protein